MIEMEMGMDLQETLKISIQKQFCYYCAVSFEDLSSFENHQCEERTQVLNGDSDSNVSIGLNETRLDDLGLNEEDENENGLKRVQIKTGKFPAYFNRVKKPSPPGFIVSPFDDFGSRKRKRPIEIKRKEVKVKRMRKRHPLKCPHRGCKLMFPSDDFLVVHLQISHDEPQEFGPATVPMTTKNTSSSFMQNYQHLNSSSNRRCLRENEKIDVYCRRCKLDFFNAQVFFDHLFNPLHANQCQTHSSSNEEGEKEIQTEAKKENINVVQGEILAADLVPSQNEAPRSRSLSPIVVQSSSQNNHDNSDNNSDYDPGHNLDDGDDNNDEDEEGMTTDALFEPVNSSEFTTTTNNNNNNNDSDLKPLVFIDKKKSKKFTHSKSKTKSKPKPKSTFKNNNTCLNMSLKSTSTPKEKLRYRRRGRQAKPKICPHPECKDLTFPTKSNLISHQRKVHPIPQEEKRKFKCPYENCARVCTEKSNLKGHIARVHEGRKDFLCNVCAKTFFDDIALKQHTLIHNGAEKKYKCKECLKSFRHRSTLNRHKTIHTGEQNYLCTHCGRAFRTADAHRVHLRIHADVRRFPCPVCPAAHNHKATLQKHLASKHPDFEGQI